MSAAPADELLPLHLPVAVAPGAFLRRGQLLCQKRFLTAREFGVELFQVRPPACLRTHPAGHALAADALAPRASMQALALAWPPREASARNHMALP